METIPDVTGDPTVDRVLLRYVQIRKMYEVIFQHNLDLRTLTRANDGKFDEHQMTDTAFFLKKIVETINDIRKECEITQEMIENKACMIWTLKSQTEADHPASVRGRVALGTPDMKMRTRIPPKDSPQYAALMAHLGVKPENADVLHVHWPGLCDYLTDLEKKGKPTPPGIDPRQTYPRNTLATRVRTGVSLDDLMKDMDTKRKTSHGKAE